MIFDTDEYGNWLCPLLDAELEWDEEGNEQRRVTRKCSSPLYVIVESTTPVTSDFDYGDRHVPVTSGWRVQCANHHVLLLSAGEENAEPFQIEFLIASERADQ